MSTPEQGYPQSHYYPTPAAPRNGLATASMVLGILGVIFACLFITSVIGLILGAVGLPLAIAARRRAGRQNVPASGTSTAGLVLNIIAVVIGAVLTVIYVAAVVAADNELDRIDQNFNNYSDCIDRYPVEDWSWACDPYLE